MPNKEKQTALAEEQSKSFPYDSPVAVSVYRAGRQMPHYHRNELEIIMCLKGSVEVYSMHERHLLHAGDIKETDTFDIHSVSALADDSDNLVVSFYFDLTHSLFAGKGYDHLYYICSSHEIDKAKKPALNMLRKLLWALLFYELQNIDRNISSTDINDLSVRILQTLRNHFQYFNDINLDDTYSIDMQNRFEHIIAYMLSHYSEKITMKDICQLEHLNYNYMSQFFKTTSLKTFRNFLHEIRVYHSEHMLLCRPEMSVPEIGYACGFSDPKLFYREFRRKHGHTPHQHRIWYRNYNGKLASDEVFSLHDKSAEIIRTVAGFFSDSVFRD